VPLVRQVGETNVAGQLATNNVLHVGGGLGDSLGVPRANGLGIAGDGVAALDERGLLSTAGGRRVPRRDGGFNGGR
jgi:hypothetical protein